MVATPDLAHAGLGGDTMSIRTDAERLGGIRSVTPSSGWELHEIRLPSGVVVHEYLTTGGRVFAVAWSGRRIPDLQQLMGDSFNDYVALLHRPRAGHHVLAVSNGHLSVQSMGHNHSFAGRAWFPGALPSGFDLGMVR